MQRFCDHMRIRPLVVAMETPQEDKEDDEKREWYRKKLMDEYEKDVLSGILVPNPPVRGPHGYAFIPLKDDAVPQRQKPFSLHGEREEAMKQITVDWLDHDFMEKPWVKFLEWLNQGFPVPKKAKPPKLPWRGVADMRGVNGQSKRINYPLPKIEDLLIKQGANQIFTIIDLKQAFHQQPLHPDSRPLTCTYTPLGIFQWKVNVMGLMNASQQFQQMMDNLLEEVSDVATPFIDDILIGTKAEPGEDLYEKHYKDCCRVMDLLRKHQLVGDKDKCQMFVKNVTFCGHILGGGERRPEPGKLRCIELLEIPKPFLN